MPSFCAVWQSALLSNGGYFESQIIGHFCAGCFIDCLHSNICASRKCGFCGQADNIKGREGDEFLLVEPAQPS